LAAFYRAAPVIASDRASYLARWDAAQLNNRAVLQDPRFGETLAVAALDRFDRTRQCLAGLLAERACGGRIREGHGDLRPEHVALFAVPLVIDCLEFNYALRQVDPFDELAYLDLECRMLGSPWVGPRLIARCAAALGDQPPPALLALYTAGRALLRARLTAAHLLEPDPRTPASWLPKTRRYVEQAQIALQSISAD
jgi:aminoglycoside phosphotransferase family enzyme